jgi:hypothetical protein
MLVSHSLPYTGAASKPVLPLVGNAFVHKVSAEAGGNTASTVRRSKFRAEFQLMFRPSIDTSIVAVA